MIKINVLSKLNDLFQVKWLKSMIYLSWMIKINDLFKLND